MPPTNKAKKPAQPGKKEEKDAKKPLQEKKPENAAAKAKKDAPKAAPKKKDPAAKPAGGADAKGKDKGKKRKLNETTQGKAKQGAASTDSKKKKVEKVQKGGQKGRVGKKPAKKQMSSKVRTHKRVVRRRRPVRVGKQEIVVYEGRRYFLLPSGNLKAMLELKLEENDKIAKVDGTFIRKSDVKAVDEFKETLKGNTPVAVSFYFLLTFIVPVHLIFFLNF